MDDQKVFNISCTDLLKRIAEMMGYEQPILAYPCEVGRSALNLVVRTKPNGVAYICECARDKETIEECVETACEIVARRIIFVENLKIEDVSGLTIDEVRMNF